MTKEQLIASISTLLLDDTKLRKLVRGIIIKHIDVLDEQALTEIYNLLNE